MGQLANINPVLYILIGPPGSGKSTWREDRIRESEAKGRQITTVSSDDIIDAYAAEHSISYTEAFGRIDQKAIKKAVNEKFDDSVRTGLDVIVDRTNMTVGARASFLSRTPKAYRKVGVVFQIDRLVLDQRLATRAEATGKSIPKDVVDDMLSKYEQPEMGAFDEIIMVIAR